MYDDSPSAARVPLGSEDVEALLLTDGADIAGQPRRVRHLLTRMRATIADHIHKQRALQRELEGVLDTAQRHESPVAAALDALAQCTYAEQRQVYDMRARGLLDALDRAHAQADNARVAAASETNRARVAVAQAAAAPGLDDATRAHLAACLAQIPIMRRPAVDAAPSTEGGFSVPARDASPTSVTQLFA